MLIKSKIHTSALFLMTLFIGLLYIPSFMYGYFWLWIVPFTGVVILFLRAMIDNAIIRVGKKGDAAIQAKAMIPEFIKMNIVMTVLLSLPFVSALWLSHAGYIEVIEQSEIDRELWQFCLWILKSVSYENKVEIPSIQILLSNIIFFLFGITAIWLSLSHQIKSCFLILFDKGTYKFINRPPNRTGFGNLLVMPPIIILMADILIGARFVSINTENNELLVFLVFLNFSVYATISYLKALFTADSIQRKNLLKK